MWYILGNHSRIVLSKLCPKTKQFPSFVSRNIRQNAKPEMNKPVIQGDFLQAPSWSDLIKPAIFTAGCNPTGSGSRQGIINMDSKTRPAPY